MRAATVSIYGKDSWLNEPKLFIMQSYFVTSSIDQKEQQNDTIILRNNAWHIQQTNYLLSGLLIEPIPNSG